MANKLEPCPFCGREQAVLIKSYDRDIFEDCFYVSCRNCQAQTASKFDEVDAIDAWNTRPTVKEDAT